MHKISKLICSTTLILYSLICIPLVAQTGGSPSGDCEMKVTQVTATEDGSDSGNRESSSDLKLIKGKPQSVKFSATTEGQGDEDMPTWDGFGGSDSFKGKTEANGSESDDFTASASACKGDSSVKVTFVPSAPFSINIGAEKSGEQETRQQLTTWLTAYQTKPTFFISGEIEGSGETVEFYDDGDKTGKKYEVSGSLTYGFAALKASLFDYPVCPGITLKPKVSFDRLQITFKLSFKYDESLSDPWDEPVEGSLDGKVGGTLGMDVIFGVDEFINVTVSGTLSTTVSAGSTVKAAGKDIQIADGHIDAGNFTGTFEVVAHVTVFQSTLYKATGTWPESGGVLHYKQAAPLTVYSL